LGSRLKTGEHQFRKVRSRSVYRHRATLYPSISIKFIEFRRNFGKIFGFSGAFIMYNTCGS